MTASRSIKILLLGVFLATPLLAAWLRNGPENEGSGPGIVNIAARTAVAAPPAAIVRVPVEVVTHDGKSRWVYVAVESRAVPEPGIFSLAALAGLLLLVRRR